jgi:glycosyltransferase involved in cell wall biosynthesis
MTDPPLTVLVVSPVAEAGGAEVLLVGILGGLQELGFRVHLVVLGEGPLCELAASRNVRPIPGPALSFRRPVSVARAIASVRRAVAATRPDIVLASHPKGQVISRLGCVGVPRVTHVTQLYDPFSPDSVSSRVAARLPGLRLAITDETAASWRACYAGLDPVLIRPGVDVRRLVAQAEEGDGDSAWTRAGLGGSGPRIVMVGRLQRFKGPFDFVEMAALVLPSEPNARFLIIGPDSPIEPDMRGELQAAIEVAGLRGAVATAGRLSAPDLAATLRDSTLLVHPARREPFGLAVVEALALGTPVVSYACEGPSMILAGGGGALVPVGSVSELARCVLGALHDPELLATWSVAAQPIARRFDLATNVARYREVLTEAVGIGPPAP